MLSPRDWMARIRLVGRRQGEQPMLGPRPASLPEVLGLPEDVRDTLLDLDRRGQLRRALRMTPGRARLAALLADLVAEHGREAFREAIAVLDLGEETDAPQAQRAPVARASSAPSATAATVPDRREAPPATPADGVAPCEALPAEMFEQLGNLNVNQWRDSRTTDGWYVVGRDGAQELYLQSSSVPPRLRKELARRELLRRDVHGVAASGAMTFTIQAGKLPFRGVLAVDVEKLRIVTGAPFEAIHARWDAAERKYPVSVIRVDEVKHEPVT